MYLVKEDLTGRIYEEIIDEIVRNDDSKVTKAIAGAIQKAKTKLSKYDLIKLFGDDTTDPEIEDQMLKDWVIDIAVWQLIKLANPNISFDTARLAYEDAIKELNEIQAGKSQPEGWPYKDTTGQTAPEGSAVKSYSNPKRSNHY